jgi:hypothetical protein
MQKKPILYITVRAGPVYFRAMKFFIHLRFLSGKATPPKQGKLASNHG